MNYCNLPRSRCTCFVGRASFGRFGSAGLPSSQAEGDQRSSRDFPGEHHSYEDVLFWFILFTMLFHLPSGFAGVWLASWLVVPVVVPWYASLLFVGSEVEEIWSSKCCKCHWERRTEKDTTDNGENMSANNRTLPLFTSGGGPLSTASCIIYFDELSLEIAAYFVYTLGPRVCNSPYIYFSALFPLDRNTSWERTRHPL